MSASRLTRRVIHNRVVNALHKLVDVVLRLFKLLENGGAKAKEIKDGYEPLFSSKEEYFAYVDKINKEGDRIVYKEDGSIEVKA